jgi:hypothetical protein
MAPCFFVYIYIFCFIQQEKRFFPHFTVYPCRVCEQTNGEQERRKKRNKTERKKNVSESNNRENVYKNEQNSTNTRIQPMRQNKEIDRQRKKKKTREENEDVG